MAIHAFSLSYGIFGRGDLVVYLNSLNFFESKDAFYRLRLSFVSGALSMIFFSVVSLTIAVIFKDAAKTWIVSAFFLILSNILLKVEFSNHWVNRYFFVKLNDTWQYFFYYKIDWPVIFRNSALLILYSFLFMALGIYLFEKKDIG
jgi:ABC-2 type transport system permease protein